MFTFSNDLSVDKSFVIKVGLLSHFLYSYKLSQVLLRFIFPASINVWVG